MKRSRLGACVGAGLCLAMLAAGHLQAATVFADNFDRADSRNVDAELTGMTDNTSSSLTADGVYTHAFIDVLNAPPAYGTQDGNADNGGGANIVNGALQLAVGAGTSNAFVNHNFTNFKQFTVSVDILGFNQSSAGQGGALAVGMSAAEAGGAGDAFNGHPIGSTTAGNKMQSAFDATGAVISDFWVALRGDSTIAWGGAGSNNVLGTASVAAKTGTISANFTAPDFNAGSTVGYEVFYNGASQGSGTFVWSGTNENYIGLDARDNTAVRFDNFTVTGVPEPGSVLLSALGMAAVACGARRR